MIDIAIPLPATSFNSVDNVSAVLKLRIPLIALTSSCPGLLHVRACSRVECIMSAPGRVGPVCFGPYVGY